MLTAQYSLGTSFWNATSLLTPVSGQNPSLPTIPQLCRTSSPFPSHLLVTPCFSLYTHIQCLFVPLAKQTTSLHTCYYAHLEHSPVSSSQSPLPIDNLSLRSYIFSLGSFSHPSNSSRGNYDEILSVVGNIWEFIVLLYCSFGFWLFCVKSFIIKIKKYKVASALTGSKDTVGTQRRAPTWIWCSLVSKYITDIMTFQL